MKADYWVEDVIRECIKRQIDYKISTNTHGDKSIVVAGVKLWNYYQPQHLFQALDFNEEPFAWKCPSK